ncbi:MAG: thioredoxin [Bacteroidaceae bacterium]|nr:thioredoxin [Bacteroidaceae bacterium]
MALEITDINYKAYLEGDKPVVLDFWAPWCGPCRVVSPIIDKLAEKYEGKIIIGKCNVDENNDLPVKYGVRNIPTVVFLKGGVVVDKQVGSAAQSVFEDKMNKLL